MTDCELAWVAGLFEGEGCIVIRPRQDPAWKPSVRLELTSTDPDVLRRLQFICGGKIAPFRRDRGGVKPYQRWTLSKMTEVADLLEAMLPWLGARRGEKAAEALSILYRPNLTKRWRFRPEAA